MIFYLETIFDSGLAWVADIWNLRPKQTSPISNHSLLDEYSLKMFQAVQQLINDPVMIFLFFLSTSCLLLLLLFLFSAPVGFRHHYSPIKIKCLHPDGNKRIELGLMDLIKRNCPSLYHGVFYPTPWLLSGHLQTIYASLMGSWFKAKRVSFVRVTLPTPDGGVISGNIKEMIHS